MPSKFELYQVDAFTNAVFSGNPAAVVPLEEWLPDSVMQSIANENNLAETAFFLKRETDYQIRWFTPTVEVDLCGHATLASAFVLFNRLGYPGNELNFYSHRSGSLRVLRDGDRLTLDFPADEIVKVELSEELIDGMNYLPVEAYRGKTDVMLIFKSEDEIRLLEPDMTKVGRLNARGVIVTAPGEKTDFVSRFFAPQSGVPEDPVTGSAHVTLTPYWSSRLGKSDLTARQLSKRSGSLWCNMAGDRVMITGEARLYLVGEIYLS